MDLRRRQCDRPAIFTVTVLGLARIREMCRYGGQRVGTLGAVTSVNQ